MEIAIPFRPSLLDPLKNCAGQDFRADLMGGPTGAFIVILHGGSAKHGAENLALCTIMAEIISFIMGAAWMDPMIKYFSELPGKPKPEGDIGTSRKSR